MHLKLYCITVTYYCRTPETRPVEVVEEVEVVDSEEVVEGLEEAVEGSVEASEEGTVVATTNMMVVAEVLLEAAEDDVDVEDQGVFPWSRTAIAKSNLTNTMFRAGKSFLMYHQHHVLPSFFQKKSEKIGYVI